MTPDSSPAALELEGLHKRFGSVRAVNGIDLSANPGELLTLLGPSGSGKTTILRLIAGFDSPTEGMIAIRGRDVARLSPAQRNVGVVFQHYALFPHLTVAQNIAYGLKRRGVKGGEQRKRVAEMLALVRLGDYGDRYPRQLSGGQQQRIAVARALAFSPAVLLMDEPLGALDRALRSELQAELRRIHGEVGTTTIYVTHDQEEALALADRIAVMHEGEVVQLGTSQELYERPRDDFVARFFGECNLFDVERVGAASHDVAEVSLDGQRLLVSSTTEKREVSLLVRPERFRLVARDGDAAFDTVVEDVLYLGGVTRLSARHPDLGPIIVRTDSREARRIQNGMPLRLYFAPADAVVIASASPRAG
jgi:putative spermidine/putrescine transport system ATP-binding protein